MLLSTTCLTSWLFALKIFWAFDIGTMLGSWYYPFNLKIISSYGSIILLHSNSLHQKFATVFHALLKLPYPHKGCRNSWKIIVAVSRYQSPADIFNGKSFHKFLSSLAQWIAFRSSFEKIEPRHLFTTLLWVLVLTSVILDLVYH